MDPLLEPISEAAPTGVDLSFETVYNDLSVLLEGTPESQFQTGSAKEPNWQAILKLSEENLQLSKDLQILIYYAVARAQISGMEGAAGALELIAGIVRKYWDTLFPNLDPEDKDPTQRLNILSQLTVAQGSFGDPVKFIERISSAAIFKVPGLAVSMAFLTQEATPGAGTGAAKLPEIMAAGDPEVIEKGIDALRRAVAAVHALDDYLIEAVGRSSSPSFDPLIKALDRGLRVFDGLTPSAADAAPAGGATATAAASATAPAAGGTRAPATAAGPGISGEIRSHDDVRRTLGKIRDFYAANEPSSPVPLLLKRAEKLIGKNFLDLLTNLTPGGRPEFDALMGPEEEEAS